MAFPRVAAAADPDDIPQAILDVKGDLIVASAADTAIRLAAGLNAQALTPDSAATGGLRWRGRVEKTLADSEFDSGNARGDGTTDCTAALNAVFSTLEGTNTPVVIPPGVWKVTDTVKLKSGVHLVMDKGAKILASNSGGLFTGSGSHAAVFQGFQSDAVSDGSLIDLVIDVDGITANGILIAGASTDYLIARPTIIDAGRAAIAFVPHTSGLSAGRANRPRVEAPVVRATGLQDAAGTTAYGVGFNGALNAIVVHPTILGAKGFGVVFDDSPDWQLWGGRIEQGASTTGFEAVGATAGSPRGLVVGTSIKDSKDNGVSLSASHCTAALLNIDTAENHGITINDHGRAIGNVIRNVGRNSIQVIDTSAESAQHAGVRFGTDGVGCMAAFNTVIESAPSGERTGNVVKALGNSTARHYVFANTFEPEGGGTLKGKPYYGFTNGGPNGSKLTDARGDSRSLYVAATPTYPLGDNDSVHITTGNADKTVVLPPVASVIPGRIFTIKNNLSGTNKTYVKPDGSETVDGTAWVAPPNVPALINLSPRQALTVVNTGSEWAVLAKY